VLLLQVVAVITDKLYVISGASKLAPAAKEARDRHETRLICLTSAGKTMLAKAVAHHTTAAFIRVVGSEFVQKYLGEVRRRLGAGCRSRRAFHGQLAGPGGINIMSRLG
jgi:26S proteasome regulatory subunit T3